MPTPIESVFRVCRQVQRERVADERASSESELEPVAGPERRLGTIAAPLHLNRH
jgi:hypothetical protein